MITTCVKILTLSSFGTKPAISPRYVCSGHQLPIELYIEERYDLSHRVLRVESEANRANYRESSAKEDLLSISNPKLEEPELRSSKLPVLKRFR